MTNAPRSPIAAGFAALSHGKLVLLLAMTTALLGLTAAMPAIPTLQEWLGGTLAGDAFVRNQPTQAPGLLFDLVQEKWPAFSGVRRSANFAGVLGLLLQVFFAGGIISVLGRGPFSFGQFLEPARRNFWHNIKCLLIFVLLLGVILGPWFGAVHAATRALEHTPPDAAVRSLTIWACVVVTVLLFAVLSLLYDFARAARRYAGVGAWRGYRFAWRALSGAWLRGLGLWIFWALIGTAVVLVGFALTWAMPAVSPFAIAILLFFQFGVLWLRSAVRVATWGSYLEFLDARARHAIAATARIRYTVASPAAPSPI